MANGSIKKRDVTRTPAKPGREISRRRFLGLALGAGLALPRPPGRLLTGQSTIRVASQLTRVDHPAATNWIPTANVIGQCLETLTILGSDNIVRPFLLKSWQAAPDLKTWTLNLRSGIKFSENEPGIGDPFTAEDVLFTIGQWFDRRVGSFMAELLGPYLDPDRIEAIGPDRVRLHLKRPSPDIPARLAHFSAFILNHRSFDGSFKRQPDGTGPFRLVYYREGVRALVKRRPDYWAGPVGPAEVEFLDLGRNQAELAAALELGRVDLIDPGLAPGREIWSLVGGNPHLARSVVPSAAASVIRMRADRAPWSDNRVRAALKLCQSRRPEACPEITPSARIGADCLSAPCQPDYSPTAVPDHDPTKARELLAQAGFSNGLEATIHHPRGDRAARRTAEKLIADAAAGGFRLRLSPMTSLDYRTGWGRIGLGVSPWRHQPTGLASFQLACGADDSGRPGRYNETGWIDREFQDLMTQAERTADPGQRRRLIGRMTVIQQQRGAIGLSQWLPACLVHNRGLTGLAARPDDRLILAGPDGL